MATTDREDIVRALRGLLWRSRFNHAIVTLSAGFGVLLFVWLVLEGSSAESSTRGWALAGGVAGVIGCLAWQIAHSGRLSGMAGMADGRCDLKDELKTAYRFIADDESSPWIDYQVERASGTSRRLDPREIVPLALPKKILAADGILALAVIGLLLYPVRAPSAEDHALSEIGNRVRQMEASLQSEDSETGAEALKNVDETLQRLAKGEVSLADGLGELQDAENRLTEASLDIGDMQEGLNEVAEQLEGDPSTNDLANALRDQRLAEAAALLRELAEKAVNAEELDENLLEQLKTTDTRSASLEDWIEALRKVAEAMEQGDAEELARRLADAAEQLDELDRELQMKQQMKEAGSQVEQIRGELARDLILRKKQGQQPDTQMLEPLDEEAQALAEELARLKLPESGKKLGGNPDGLPMGPADPTPPMEEEPTSLEVQLEREMLDTEEEPEEPDPEEIIQRPSQKRESKLAYEPVQRTTTYVEAEVMHPDRIPWRYRSIIQQYFQAIQQKAEQ